MFYERQSQYMEEPAIVGLDIGSTKVVMVAGKRNREGQIQIFGFGRADSLGVDKADVINIMNTSNAIKDALAACKQSAGEGADLAIKQVCVGVAGHHVRSIINEMDIVRENPKQQITEEEIEMFVELQNRINIPPGQRIIDIIPKHFEIDGKNVNQHIVGCNGHRLKGAFHIVTADIKACDNMETAVNNAGLSIQSWELQPLASACAIVGQEDLEAGVLVMDIGGGTTDIAVFQQGTLQHTQVIPLGGKLLTSHIANTFQILENMAEQLKLEHGKSRAEGLDASKLIVIPSRQGLPSKQVSVNILAEVIEKNMCKTLDYVEYFLQQRSINRESIMGGILLTGGGSRLKKLQECVAMKMALYPRNGNHTRYLAPGFPMELKHPEYATSIGLLIKGFQDFDKQWHKRELIMNARQQSRSDAPNPLPKELERQPRVPPSEEGAPSPFTPNADTGKNAPLTSPPHLSVPIEPTSAALPAYQYQAEVSTKRKKPGFFSRMSKNLEQAMHDFFGDDDDEPIR